MPASADDLRHVRARVLRWYDAEKRDLPWRRTRDPYPVLVSEVMLQQTQASRVIGRFSRFLARFPSVEALASATTAEVLAEWSGLGYNRRALALQRAAAEVVRAGGWPRDVEGLRRLPGIGPYTARALASLAFGQPVGAVDTNVRRWLVRRFAVADAPPAIQQLADALASTGADGRADAWTNASIEFGAVVCRARSPRCDACPIRTGCPSRGAGVTVPVPRQAPLAGSDREVRGAVLRHLAGAEGHASAERTLRAALARELVAEVDTDRWERVLSALERDGLAHRQAGSLRLGAATIDP
jgi:A/G-specific adenine glycosylase